MKLPEELANLLRQVPALSRAYLVGGCVRDSLLGVTHKDFDLEVYGVDYEILERALRSHGRVDLVGKSFGVIKFTGQIEEQWDFSLSRRDSKMAAGHKGFQSQFEPDIQPREAASRRDFAANPPECGAGRRRFSLPAPVRCDRDNAPAAHIRQG